MLERGGDWAADNAATLAGVGAGILVGLWLTADVWGSRLPAGGDVTGHLIRAEASMDLLKNGQLDGWSPRFGLGYQQSLFYGPGFGWLLAALRVLTFGTLSNAGALKVVMIGSVIAIPVAAGFCARCMGLSRRGAGIAAVLSLLASSPFGVGLHGLFENGLVPQQIGGVLFLVALGASIKTLTEERRAWQVLLGLTVAAIIVTHMITLAILGLFLLCVLAYLALNGTLTRTGVARLAVALGVAAGLAAFWIVPFLAHRNLHGPVATWSTPPFGTRINDIFNGSVLFKPIAATAVIAGLAYGFVRVGQRQPYALLLVLGPIVALALGHWSIHGVPNELTLQLANRELGLAGILLTFPLAAGLDAVAQRLNPSSWLATAAVLIAAAYLVLTPWTEDPPLARQARPVVADMRATARELARLVPPEARFVTIRDYPKEVERTGAIQPDRWLAWASGRNTLNTFPIEVSSTPEASTLVDRLTREPVASSARALARFGVTHVVTTSPQQTASLARSGRFKPVWTQGTMTISALAGEAGRPPPETQVTAPVPVTVKDVDSPRAGELVLDVNTAQPTTATIALAWSPKWHGVVNGRDVDLGRTSDGLVTLNLPSGDSHVELSFRHDGWDVMGLTITILFVIGGLGLIVARPARKPQSEGLAPPLDSGP